ncbi:MAG: D-alanyl-D-alanine endopeptidase [Limnobacter sp.]|nr:D-alanyl-D-alanine endopeptidase [Limnobacter sp.]
MRTSPLIALSLLLTALAWQPVLAGGASVGVLAGLKQAHDPLDLKSSVALVADADSQEVIFAKNPSAVLPIASITKLMTVVVTLEAGLSMKDIIEITPDDYDNYKHTSSRLRAGDKYSREELLHLALMASENRAASALGRSYPGGKTAFVRAMNTRAQALHMTHTLYVEPTGLSSDNRSSANDLALLVMHASSFKLIRQFSTSREYSVYRKGKALAFRNTNHLVKKPEWDIDLQKTGYINEAGRCMVMKTRINKRNVVIVLLDSIGRAARTSDAERLREFVASSR